MVCSACPEAARSLKAKASLVYRVNSGIARATQRTPFSKQSSLAREGVSGAPWEAEVGSLCVRSFSKEVHCAGNEHACLSAIALSCVGFSSPELLWWPAVHMGSSVDVEAPGPDWEISRSSVKCLPHKLEGLSFPYQETT